MIEAIYIAAVLALVALIQLYISTRRRFAFAPDELDPEIAELQAIGAPVDGVREFPLVVHVPEDWYTPHATNSPVAVRCVDMKNEDEYEPLHDHHVPQLAKLSEHLEK